LKGQQHHRPQQVEGHGHPEQGLTGLIQAFEGGGLGTHAVIVGDTKTPAQQGRNAKVAWKLQYCIAHVSFEQAGPWGYE
jgi:hypothetical protein